MLHPVRVPPRNQNFPDKLYEPSAGGGSSLLDEIAGLATEMAYTKRHLFLWQYQQRL